MKTAEQAQVGDRVWLSLGTGGLVETCVLEPELYNEDDMDWGFLAADETVIGGVLVKPGSPDLVIKEWVIGRYNVFEHYILEGRGTFLDALNNLKMNDGDMQAIQDHVRKHSGSAAPKQDKPARQAEILPRKLIAVNAAGAELWIYKDGESYGYQLAGETHKEDSKEPALNAALLTGMYRLLGDAWMHKIATKRHKYNPRRVSLLAKAYFLKYPDADATGFHQALSFYRAFVDGFDDMGIKEQGDKMTCHPKEALMAMNGAATAYFSTIGQPAISPFEAAIQEHVDSQPQQSSPQFGNVKLLIKFKGLDWVKTNLPDAWRALAAAELEKVRKEGDLMAKPGPLAGKTPRFQ